MSTYIVRVVDTTGGRLRGVVERIADRQQVPFADQGQLLAVLADEAVPSRKADVPLGHSDAGERS
jgi:hypothetical protein